MDKKENGSFRRKWVKVAVAALVVLMIAGVYVYKMQTQTQALSGTQKLETENKNESIKQEDADNSSRTTQQKPTEVPVQTKTTQQAEMANEAATALQSTASTVQNTPTQADAVRALPRLIDFGSTTCRPCIEQAPILEDLKAEYAGRVDVTVLDVYDNRAIAGKYKIRVIPTQIFLDENGNEYMRHEGFMPKSAIVSIFAQMGVK